MKQDRMHRASIQRPLLALVIGEEKGFGYNISAADVYEGTIDDAMQLNK